MKIEPMLNSSKLHLYIYFIRIIVKSLFTRKKQNNFLFRQLLGSQSPSVDKTDSPCQYVFRRRRADIMPRSPALKMTEDSFTDGDDELLESLVKTATSTPRTTPRERKRTRNADRKSCELSLKCAHQVFFSLFFFSFLNKTFTFIQ